MRVFEKTKSEIDSKLQGMGDYVKMEYLQDCLKSSLDFETRKFVLIRLATIYEERRMFSNAGKLYRHAAEINTTFQGKVSDFLKSCELYIKGGDFNDADVSMRHALGCSGSDKDKEKVKEIVKNYYLTQAKIYFQKDQRKHCLDSLEKAMTFPMSLEEKKKVQEKVLYLYNKLGKVKEYLRLKDNLD